MVKKNDEMFLGKTYGDHESGKAFTSREDGNVCVHTDFLRRHLTFFCSMNYGEWMPSGSLRLGDFGKRIIQFSAAKCSRVPKFDGIAVLVRANGKRERGLALIYRTYTCKFSMKVSTMKVG